MACVPIQLRGSSRGVQLFFVGTNVPPPSQRNGPAASSTNSWLGAVASRIADLQLSLARGTEIKGISARDAEPTCSLLRGCRVKWPANHRQTVRNRGPGFSGVAADVSRSSSAYSEQLNACDLQCLELIGGKNRRSRSFAEALLAELGKCHEKRPRPRMRARSCSKRIAACLKLFERDRWTFGKSATRAKRLMARGR